MAVHLSQLEGVSGTGNFSVTGLAFEPVGVMFFGIDQGLELPTNFFGAASGSGEEWVIWTGLRQQASTYTQRHNEIRDDCCIFMYEGTNHSVVLCKASFVSMNSDGFTINFSVFGGNEPLYYVAIGGDNISAAYAGTVAFGSSTGTTAVTGVGFQPKAVVACHVANGSLNTQGSNMTWGQGFATATDQYSACAVGLSGAATTGYHMHRTDAISCCHIAGVVTYRAELDSMDSDGFTVDVVDASEVGNFQHGYLAIDAVVAAVGNGTRPDTTGTQQFSTPGFEPAGVLFTWTGADTPSTAGASTMPVRPGVGAMDGISGLNDPDAAGISLIHRASAPFGAYVPDAFSNTDAAINIRGNGSQVDPDAVTERGVADFDSFAQGSFTINWTTALSGADNAFGWLALPGDIEINWIPHIYRRVLVT